MTLSTYHDNVLCNLPCDTSRLAPCTQEEADTRIFLYLEDIVKEGRDKVTIRTVDTDVVVFVVAASQRLSHIQLWIAYGVGKHFKYLASHEIATTLGPSKCRALPFFHALSGCDIVSFFHGMGKKTAWATLKNLDAVTAFCSLGSTPQQIEPYFELIEQFIVLLYDRTTTHTSVNQARKELFAQKGRAIDLIPPTQAALIQHVKRTTYQAGYCWSQSCIAAPEMPSPSVWGWTKNDTGKWDVFWTDLPEATKACRELLRCGCKKGCCGQCKCLKAALKCTALCFCAGNCDTK